MCSFVPVRRPKHGLFVEVRNVLALEADERGECHQHGAGCHRTRDIEDRTNPGSAKILCGVPDTGVDLRHPDRDERLDGGEQGKHLAQLVVLHTLGHNGAAGGKAIAAHDVDCRAKVVHPRIFSEPFDKVARNYRAQEEGNEQRVADLQHAQQRDANCLTDEVNNLRDSPVVAVLLDFPVVSCSHIVVADCHLAKEGKDYCQHNKEVNPQVKSFAAGSGTY